MSGDVGEVQGDPFQSRKCYVEVVLKGQKRNRDEDPKGSPFSQRDKGAPTNKYDNEAPPNKCEKEDVENKENEMAPSKDLEWIDPNVITHHLNINPHIKLVKQKKRLFGPEKDKIVQAGVDKLLSADHIEEI
ncbi:UNVERIFIED_CONTAM: hypothetical protein Sindi_1646300 [Sesamum indicum]